MLVPHTISSKGEGLVLLNKAHITTTTFKDFSLFSNITCKDSSVSVRTEEDFSGSEKFECALLKMYGYFIYEIHSFLSLGTVAGTQLQ